MRKKTIRDALIFKNKSFQSNLKFKLACNDKCSKISDYCQDKESLNFYASKPYLKVSSYNPIHINYNGKTFIPSYSLYWRYGTYFDKDKISDYLK